MDVITEIVLQRKQQDIKIVHIQGGFSVNTGLVLCRTTMNENESVYIMDIKPNTRAFKTNLKVFYFQF